MTTLTLSPPRLSSQPAPPAVGVGVARGLFVHIMLVCLISLAGLEQTQAQSQGFNVEDVIAAIKDEIRTAQATETGEPRLKIDRVEVELTIVAAKSGSGGLKFEIPVVGAKLQAEATRRATHVLKLILSPSNISEVRSPSNFGLVSALRQVKQALRNAIHKPPALRLENFVFEIEFLVTKKAGIGLQFLIFEIPNLDIEHSYSHKLKIFMSLAT